MNLLLISPFFYLTSSKSILSFGAQGRAISLDRPPFVSFSDSNTSYTYAELSKLHMISGFLREIGRQEGAHFPVALCGLYNPWVRALSSGCLFPCPVSFGPHLLRPISEMLKTHNCFCPFVATKDFLPAQWKASLPLQV